ncbi:hypothetical protein [Chitinivorax sp. B]|uniref:hypothetical protein n=1 Tax=Chitinivorax sp. B TaxID=2502235 RepID=UPI001485498D|nr:hypothetical protein [Chitinivorax sp. B]
MSAILAKAGFYQMGRVGMAFVGYRHFRVKLGFHIKPAAVTSGTVTINSYWSEILATPGEFVS